MESVTVDVAVVGGGAAGLATAWHLAERGRRVAVFERFDAGHTYGSSHGTERILRIPYADPVHVDLVLAAMAGWDRLEHDARVVLRTTTGGLDAGAVDELAALAEQCRRADVPIELLTPSDAGRRFPGLALDGDVLFQPWAATVHADATLAALRLLVARRGASVHHRCPVTAVDLARDGVVVGHAAGECRADVAVVTTGGWDVCRLFGAEVGSLPGLASIPPLRVSQEQVLFFRPRSGGDRWPTFIDRGRPTVYGMTTPDGLIKIGEHHTGPVVDPDDRPDGLDDVTLDRLIDWVRAHAPGVDPRPVRSATCLYASLPGDLFVLDRSGPIVVGAGLSGHGFKFVPEIGRRLADLADGVTNVPNAFGWSRNVPNVGASGHR